MRLCKRHRHGPSWPRRLTAILTLASYLAAIIGLPLPNLPAKDQGRPFPCQNNACGCRSAEQCWQNCCCYSPEERLAWARAHNVQPPPQIQAGTSASWRSSRLRERDNQRPAPGCHCSSDTGATPTEETTKRDPSETPSCCQEQETEEATAESTAGSRWAPGLAALRCQGGNTLWISTGSVMPPPVFVWCPCQPSLGWLTHADARAVELEHQPPCPPPRPAQA